MKKFIFWKKKGNKKETVLELYSYKTKQELKQEYQSLDFDGIDSVI